MEEKICGALVHTRGFGDMQGPIFCGLSKPCDTHKFSDPDYESDFDRFLKDNPIKNDD